MKIKNKGKVHPSPPPPPPSLPSADDCLSVLKLLPAVILVLVSSLSSQDREVLSYLITRSLKTTTTDTSSSTRGRSNNKKKSHNFDCECFDCYTSYWFRWDSSPNRELIHQIIEGFEEHLSKGEERSASRKTNGGRGKKKEKLGRRVVEVEPLRGSEERTNEVKEPMELVVVSDGKDGEKDIPMTIVKSRVAAVTGHRGLLRKVLPDVLGLFNSRFFSLWNPNQ